MFAEAVKKMTKYSKDLNNRDAVLHAGGSTLAKALFSTWAHGEELYNAITPNDKKLSYGEFISGMKKAYSSDTAPKTMAQQTKTR